MYPNGTNDTHKPTPVVDREGGMKWCSPCNNASGTHKCVFDGNWPHHSPFRVLREAEEAEVLVRVLVAVAVDHRALAALLAGHLGGGGSSVRRVELVGFGLLFCFVFLVSFAGLCSVPVSSAGWSELLMMRGPLVSSCTAIRRDIHSHADTQTRGLTHARTPRSVRDVLMCGLVRDGKRTDGRTDGRCVCFGRPPD